MEYISSDTSVWIDFSVIDQIQLPFRLPYTYIMNADAISDEILSPVGLGAKLTRCGLVPVDISIDEFFIAEELSLKYPSLSRYDRIALAIAKIRGIVLLTGDGSLRKAAKFEGVSILGTIGILDQLYKGKYITDDEYELCLIELNRNNGFQVRLPKDEISSRLVEFGLGRKKAK